MVRKVRVFSPHRRDDECKMIVFLVTSCLVQALVVVQALMIVADFQPIRAQMWCDPCRRRTALAIRPGRA